MLPETTRMSACAKFVPFAWIPIAGARVEPEDEVVVTSPSSRTRTAPDMLESAIITVAFTAAPNPPPFAIPIARL